MVKVLFLYTGGSLEYVESARMPSLEAGRKIHYRLPFYKDPYRRAVVSIGERSRYEHLSKGKDMFLESGDHIYESLNCIFDCLSRL